MLSDSVVEVTPQALQKIGADLFDSVFNGDIKILYHKSIKQAKDLGRNLRVNFRNDLSNLSSTPWEIMFDKQKMNFISCNEIAPFTRSGPWDEIIIQRQRPINILLIIAKPKSMNGTTLDHINANLRRKSDWQGVWSTGRRNHKALSHDFQQREGDKQASGRAAAGRRVVEHNPLHWTRRL